MDGDASKMDRSHLPCPSRRQETGDRRPEKSGNRLPASALDAEGEHKVRPYADHP